MAKRLIPRHQVGKKLPNLLESFGNALIAGESGADGIIYQGIKDNQMSNQTITKTLHPDVGIIKLQ